MRPVDEDEMSDLLEWRPLLILNKTRFGPAFVNNIVSRSPELISSKGGKKLPLELWYLIIEFSATSSEEDEYALVRPSVANNSGEFGEELVCSKYKRWQAFNTIASPDEVREYTAFLSHPDRKQSKCQNPFGDPRTREFGPPVKIPTELFASEIKFLYVKLTVPDVIRYLEEGRCSYCWGWHTVRPSDISEFSLLAFLCQHLHDTLQVSDPLLCPLCVGLEHARDSLLFQTMGPRPPMIEYSQWLVNRLRELGFESSEMN